jgi:hypothetical protein
VDFLGLPHYIQAIWVYDLMARPPTFRIEDLIGKKINRLTVLDFATKDKHGIRMVRCACECGNESIAGAYAVKSGATKSCGCLSREAGHARLGERRSTWNGYRAPNHPNVGTWNSYCSMKTRCFNPNDKTFLRYGGNGITACERWKNSFLEFVKDLGERPDGLSLDRINSKGHYSCGKCAQCLSNGWPMNCKWSTGSEQCFNRSISRPITINGETKFFSQWCEQFGIATTTVNQRERYGWDIITALTTPVKQGGQIGLGH